MPAELTPDQRVALIEQLEAQEAGRRAKAVRMAWGAVAAAALVLAAIVFGAWRELRVVQVERDDVAAEIERLDASRAKVEAELAEVEDQLKASRATLSASLGALGLVSESQRRAAVEQQLKNDPSAAEALPRVYLHVVDSKDREWATEIGRKLESAGMIALGVEYVSKAAGLKNTDVRYYKKAEEPGALRIKAFLESVGVEAKLSYLGLENNTRVRLNHFEVWFAAGARNSALP